MLAKTLLRTRGSVRRRPGALLLIGVALGALAILTLTGTALASPDWQPKTTHAVQGRENCLTCHPVGGGVKPSPASHASYTDATCLGCHPAGEAAPAAPAQAAPGKAEAPAAPAAVAAAPAASCLDCHKNAELSATLPNGEKLNLFVDQAQMAGSVHGDKLACVDCHTSITGFPHKKPQASSRREYSLAQYEACKRCHFANYTKTLDSMHYQVLESGNQKAPLCTDCHGYHNVSRAAEPRSKISLSCAGCHSEVYKSYTESVHGAALVMEENRDVPVCTDCHGTHTIRDSGTAAFRLDSPEMCGKCHADEALMRKYNLSANVFKTYLQDFHGTTVALTKRQGIDNWTTKAVCSDCHGVHNIKSVKGGNQEQIKQNVVSTCQKCHPNAGANFPDAWLSHYEMSLDKAPVPWLVRAWYVVLIPFMLGGLMLHIGVDLWRIARNR